MIVATPPAPPQTFADALEYVLPKVWNESQSAVHFGKMDCHKGGTRNHETVYVCTTSYTHIRSGRVEYYRFQITGYGQVLKADRIKVRNA